MTSLKGDLRSIMGTPFGGVGHAVLIFSRVTRAAFDSDSVILQLHDRIEMPEEANGKFQVDGLDPGPIRIELEGGTVHNHGWNIDLPDEGVWSLTDLVDAQVDWSPAVIGRAEAAAREARDHADRAEAGADRVGTAEQVGVWASEASSSASAAASARSGAVTARNAAQSARDVAEGHATRAASSASNAAASESAAKQSETNAGDYAAVATTAATEAVDAMERATDLAGGDFATHEYVDEGLGLKAEQKDLESIRGRVNNIEPANANQSGSTVWAHATERGHRLPLGYDENGGLDEHAKTAFSEALGVADKADKEEVESALSQKQDSIDVDNPDYQWAMINTRSQLLMGVRNDGTLIAPKHRLSPPSEYTKNDKGEWVPVFADTSQLTIWGSSTPAGLSSYIADAFADAPVAVNNMAKGGEMAQHSAARMGAILAVVAPITIPASGSVPLTFVDFAPPSVDYVMRSFTATIGGVEGMVDTTGNNPTFTRTAPGDAITLTGPTEVIPLDGPQAREHVTLLGVGKNNLTSPQADLVINYTDAMVNYLTPKYPRFLILGHHHNRGLEQDADIRSRVDQVNQHGRDTYGPLYFDTIAAYTDLDRWAAAGITPTQADLDDLALGNKPPSLSHDTSHFNAAGYRLLAQAVRDHMTALGWY